MLKISLFRLTVKICDHSLYTQIVVKKILLFFTHYKNEWKERKFWRQNNKKK